MKYLLILIVWIIAVTIPVTISGCGNGNYIFREFNSKAIQFTTTHYPKSYWIHFSNGEKGYTYNIDWITFQTDYNDKCFNVITHEEVHNHGPGGRKRIDEIVGTPCSPDMDESVTQWNSWEDKND